MVRSTTRKLRAHVSWLNLLWVAMALGCAAGAVYAQAGHATINGTITDASGAVIAGAEISIRSVETGQTTKVNAATGGNYSVPFLPVGTYEITATHPGFSPETRTGVTITADQVATISFTLKVGALSAAVEVKAESVEINTTTGAIGEVINEKSVAELPLNGRNPAELVFTVPGAVNGATISGIALPGVGSGFPLSETGASVNGSRMGQVFYELDGVSHMDNYFQTANPFPNPDATQEFRVITNNFDAQYGFSGGAVVSIATKSGSNNWHGDLFEFLRNNDLNSADFFTHQADPLKRNQFGGSLGGPIKHNKLFIFGNFQQTIQHESLSGSSTSVPNNKMLTGDFSNVSLPLHDPSGNPYPGNQIPVSQFDPITTKLLAGLPRTDDPNGNIITIGQNEIDNTREFTVRGDYYFSENNRLSARYFYDNFDRPAFSGNGDYAISQRGGLARSDNVSANETWTVRPNLVNNVQIGYNRINSSAVPGLVDTNGKPISPSILGADIPSPATPTIGLIGVNPGFWISAVPVVQQRHNWVANDTLSLNTSKHQITAGVNVFTQYSFENATWGADALMNFNGAVTGNSFADFLLGDLSTFEQSGGEYNKLHGVNIASFVQDSIKLKPNLTINVGVRWEPQVAPRYEQDKLAFFWPGHQSTLFSNAPPGLVYAGDAGVPKGGWNSDWKAFSPRLSVAWEPIKNTSIRSAFGMFVMPYDFSFYNHMGPNAPFSPDFNFNNTQVPCVLKIDNPYACYAPTGDKAPFPPFAGPNFHPPANSPIAVPVGMPATFSPNFKMGRTQQWNFSIEHALHNDFIVRVAYLGMEAYHVPVPMDLNPGVFSAGGARTTYSNFSEVLAYTSGGTQSYNALQISVNKNFSHGLQFTSNYTWSKNIDANSAATLSNVGGVADPFNLRANRGISDLNTPQIWNNTWVYQSPSQKGLGKVGDFFLGSWEMSGIWTLHSGIPFTVFGGEGQNNSLSQQNQDHADYIGGSLNVHQGSKANWLNQYFNTAAFTDNAAGTFGNVARNLLTGPGWDNVDVQFSKNFPFRERYRVQFRWELFNAFNRTYFAPPDANFGDLNFGRITSEYNGNPNIRPRLMQAALKFVF